MVGFSHLGDREVYRGHLWTVSVGTFTDPDGHQFSRDIVRSPGAVGVVPILFDPEGRASVVLVEQYRPSLGRPLVEIPAGMRDIPGEAPEHTAARELAEEAGLRAESLTFLAELHPTPGMTDASTIVYLATGCVEVAQDLQGPEEQHLRVLHVPFAEAIEMVEQGAITDAKSVIGLLMAERRVGHG